jgi:hypothetical protein
MEIPTKESDMRLGSRLAMGAVACLLGSMLLNGQARPQQRLMADQVHKNIQVLKGLPEDEFMATMGFFSASLGENCTYCHVAESSGSWEKYADDNDHKKTARAMIGMMNVINKNFFGGRRVVTCYSCHRGGERPDVTPSIADLYGPPPTKEPDQIVEGPAKGPSADQILTNTSRRSAGRSAWAASPATAKGTYQGYADEKHPV